MQNNSKNFKNNNPNMLDICDQIDQKLLTLESYIKERSSRRSE